MNTTNSTLLNDADSVQYLECAANCVTQVQSLVDTALKHIKDQCTVADKFEPGLLDEKQLVSYELAFCVAELKAATVLIDFAHQARLLDTLSAHVSLSYSAEAIQSVLQRLTKHANDLGLTRRQVLELNTAPAATYLLGKYLAADVIAAIGAELIDRNDARLPTLLDDEKEMVRDSFARFADEVVAPLAEKIHRQDLDIPEEIIRSAAELGCFGTCIPERFGGLMPDHQSDSLSMIVVTEELSRGSLGAAGSLITRPEIAARALLNGGTPDQQQSWLPRLATAEVLCAIAITEPDFGSDVASVSLKASPTAGGWLLNGNKTWCTFAGKADMLLTLARTNPDTSKGYKGLSLFLVEKPSFAGHQFSHLQTTGGKLTGNAIATLGYRGMHSYDLSFEDFFVASDHLLGGEEGEGKGFYHIMAGFSGGRIQTAARATGVMQAAIEQALSYANNRNVFGAALGDYQLTQVKLGRMIGALTASRQFSYAVAKMMDEGGGKMEASLVKLFTCRAAEWISREALQIHGGMGYAEESPVSRYFVDARVLSIFEGAEETLALKVIARDLIANA
jgi:(2S)-methylsuccinyl-CoA dehydrogenase